MPKHKHYLDMITKYLDNKIDNMDDKDKYWFYKTTVNILFDLLEHKKYNDVDKIIGGIIK